MLYFKKILIAAAIILIAGFAWVYIADNKNEPVTDRIIQEPTPTGPVSDSRKKNSSDAASPTGSNTQTEDTLPGQVALDISFLAQAPFGVWDPLHEDACEEASLIMAKHFLDKDKNLTPASGDTEIIKIIQYEERNGYGISITLDQLNKIAKEYLGMQTGRIKDAATIDDIKKELAAGRPVIVPAAGKVLPNPNFKDGGPVYHMLVVKGYDKNGFITNDPGTRKGEGFRYSFGDLYYAMHDWDAANIFNGSKAYLVFD